MELINFCMKYMNKVDSSFEFNFIMKLWLFIKPSITRKFVRTNFSVTSVRKKKLLGIQTCISSVEGINKSHLKILLEQTLIARRKRKKLL